MRDSTGKSTGAATQEAELEIESASLTMGTAVAVSEKDVGDGGDVGDGLGDEAGNSTPHPATSASDRTTRKSASLRIVASFV